MGQARVRTKNYIETNLLKPIPAYFFQFAISTLFNSIVINYNCLIS